MLKYAADMEFEKAAELRYSIIPSLTKELNEIADKENSKKDLDNRSEDSLLRQEVTEEDIANLVWFLSSDESRFINKEIIRIDGGMYD